MRLQRGMRVRTAKTMPPWRTTMGYVRRADAPGVVERREPSLAFVVLHEDGCRGIYDFGELTAEPKE